VNRQGCRDVMFVRQVVPIVAVDDSAFFLDCLTFKIKASLSFETL
jgi:hypothetical protein